MQANNLASSLSELCLRYPEPLGVHPQVTYESAVQMLVKAYQLAVNVPFQWSYIDRPQDGSLYMVFLLPQQRGFPNDGIRYQDQENRYSIPAGSGRELEICEIKFGFIPDSSDTTAYRLRRRFRLIKGGNPQLILVHYSAYQQMPIIPAIRSQPVRSYPLRPVNEPAMYVVGEKMGQKVFLPQQQHGAHPTQIPHVASGMPGMGGMGGGMQHQASMLAHQNREMEALERRQARERTTGMPGHSQHPQVHDDDSGDEYDHISTRSLALARYKRNHDYMNEVFMHAAFGDKKPKEPQNPYACFEESEIKEKVMKLEKEIEELKTKAAEREAMRRQANAAASDITNGGESGLGDVSMESIDRTPVEVVS
ncbi:hypothetical protein DFH11DRAFT_1565886 [Phellopilus nigrolimitatus]|nr:hypothetical protein DFH11DRAFT_1565886 [Phellopilus nigrolimitatus]